MTWAIETEALTRRFDDHVAVEALSFSVAAGETYALLGPNGAGKTTTVRMLCGVLSPSAGTARVLGSDVGREAAAVRGQVGLLTETPGLYDRLTVLQVLAFFAELYDIPEPGERIRRYLELLGLWEQRDAPTATLSKGMKQKVALVRALFHEPRLLFLDEPTAGLDVPTQRTVRELLTRLKAEGRTVVLTTHNLDEAERVADRIGLLSTRMVAEGTPEELRRRLVGRRVRVRVERVTPELVAAARAVSGTNAVESSRAELRVELADVDERTPDLVAALVAAGGRVRAVEVEEASLEEVYLRLLGPSAANGEATGPPGGPSP
jgi:ABC-2 type transport system ATP-binding protein